MSISPTGRNNPERHHPTDEQRLASLQSEFGVSPPGSPIGERSLSYSSLLRPAGGRANVLGVGSPFWRCGPGGAFWY